MHFSCIFHAFSTIQDEERGGRASIEFLEQGAETADFWNALGGEGAVAAAVSDDEPVAATAAARLFRVSDASGSVRGCGGSRACLSRMATFFSFLFFSFLFFSFLSLLFLLRAHAGTTDTDTLPT
jgi:hypothetical protein